jgi:hypothetical protein
MRHCISLTILMLVSGISANATARPLQDSSSSHATTAARRSPDPQRQLDRLTHKLQLTQQQSTAIALILQHRAREIAKLRGDNTIDRRHLHLQIRSINHAADQQVSARLTDSQRMRYALIEQKLQQRHHDRKAANGGDGKHADDGH